MPYLRGFQGVVPLGQHSLRGFQGVAPVGQHSLVRYYA